MAPQVKGGYKLEHWRLEPAFQRMSPTAELQGKEVKSINQKKEGCGWGTTAGLEGRPGHLPKHHPCHGLCCSPLSLQVLVLG